MLVVSTSSLTTGRPDRTRKSRAWPSMALRCSFLSSSNLGFLQVRSIKVSRGVARESSRWHIYKSWKTLLVVKNAVSAPTASVLPRNRLHHSLPRAQAGSFVFEYTSSASLNRDTAYWSRRSVTPRRLSLRSPHRHFPFLLKAMNAAHIIIAAPGSRRRAGSSKATATMP